MRARIRICGREKVFSGVVLVDTGAKMSLVDESTAEHIGVEYTW